MGTSERDTGGGMELLKSIIAISEMRMLSRKKEDREVYSFSLQ